jgi:hypothetical protein
MYACLALTGFQEFKGSVTMHFAPLRARTGMSLLKWTNASTRRLKRWRDTIRHSLAGNRKYGDAQHLIADTFEKEKVTPAGAFRSVQV